MIFNSSAALRACYPSDFAIFTRLIVENEWLPSVGFGMDYRCYGAIKGRLKPGAAKIERLSQRRCARNSTN
jgi:hypothetical protein